MIETILEGVPKEWHPILLKSLSNLEDDYLQFLIAGDYLPGRERLFNAFKSLKPTDVRYILFGQDPYPRKESATGYAFIDGKVKDIFSDKGLSKEINRATSLRNFIKTLLVIDGYLSCKDTSQEAISKIDKSNIIKTLDELKDNLISNGVLLLNTALVFESKNRSRYHLKIWKSFIRVFLEEMNSYSLTLILFGNYANNIQKILPPLHNFTTVSLEHPYNHSFICNKNAHNLFKPMQLLKSSI